MNKLIFLLAVLPTTLAGAATAQSLSQRYAVEIDTNKDGAISRAEYVAMTRDHFARQDRNGDGKLEGAERPSYLASRASVTQQDYVDVSLQVFNGEDTDHNGIVEGEELKRFWAHMDRGAPKAGQPAAPAHSH